MSNSSSSSDQIVWKRSKGRSGEVTTTTTTTEEVVMEDDNHHHHYHHNHHYNNKKKYQVMPKRYDLVSYRELPDYMKDNEFILNHYRANWPLKVAFFSLFRWHNETLNVWTHLIGFVVFVGLTVTNVMELPQLTDLLNKFSTWKSFSATPAMNASHNSKDFFMATTAFMVNTTLATPTEMLTAASEVMAVRWPFFVFLGGAMFCLLSSSTCHLFCCHTHHMNILLLRFDYVGIAVMIVTSFFPPIYYIFQCNPIWQVIYLTGITTMGIFTIVTLLSPSLSTKEFRSFRALLFFSMGISGIIPAIHACIVNWSEPRRFITLAYESAMALSYAIGTLFYVTRIPERWRPGWFDLAGHSHQIFHLFVIMGALAHYAATHVFIDWRDSVGCTSRSL
ncbi:Heptahelical transmembrane protein [Thalictrum thalictroides]|uniref:Heptahelical transmembrane protein n=1 Tax=Thalictrum thalictroides TaxID=46969 RepID=A0A7J6UYM8_THATH|nr:Heptahelical transmembrane protein [Thalictrum thalictroides]